MLMGLPSYGKDINELRIIFPPLAVKGGFASSNCVYFPSPKLMISI
jgi:hypothetical protein